MLTRLSRKPNVTTPDLFIRDETHAGALTLMKIILTFNHPSLYDACLLLYETHIILFLMYGFRLQLN